jgi:ABC-2 type transport system permease protein
VGDHDHSPAVLLVIVRGVFLKGVGLDVLWPQFAALGAWGVTVLGLAAMRSRKRA